VISAHSRSRGLETGRCYEHWQKIKNDFAAAWARGGRGDKRIRKKKLTPSVAGLSQGTNRGPTGPGCIAKKKIEATLGGHQRGTQKVKGRAVASCRHPRFACGGWSGGLEHAQPKRDLPEAGGGKGGVGGKRK